MTVRNQVEKVRQWFGIDRVALVGDRGMITAARIREDLEPWGLDWMRPEALAADGVGEIESPKFAGERLIACFNPRLKERRGRAGGKSFWFPLSVFLRA